MTLMLDQQELQLLWQRTHVKFSEPTWKFTTVCNSSSKECKVLSGLLGHLAYTLHTDLHADKILVYRKQNHLKKKRKKEQIDSTFLSLLPYTVCVTFRVACLHGLPQAPYRFMWHCSNIRLIGFRVLNLNIY